MFNLLLTLCWLVFIFFWIASGVKVKDDKITGNKQPPSILKLLVTTAIVILLFNTTRLKQLINYQIFPDSFVVQTVGVIVCASGIAFAIWARTILGKNWGVPMAIKEKPELVMGGPYYFIRHPIYTGIAIAMFGSLITAGFIWLFWFTLFSTYFIYSARKEEKTMLVLFPKEYHDYMKRTRMFIPFIY